ncbi:MAG: hypothetical protein JW951_06310 [Lentisphaerae bacterium]|nr:hypothetical protein [Lentisphaerota bacterium]
MIFAPERMECMELLALREDVERLTGLLAGEGSVHLVEQPLPPGGAETAGPADAHGEEIRKRLSLADELLGWLDAVPLDVGRREREACLAERTTEVLARADEALGALRDALAEHFRKREAAASELTRLNALSEQMHLLNEHGLSFRDLQDFRHVHAVCGTLERAHAERLSAGLADAACAMAMRPVFGDRVAFLLLGDREEQARYDAMLAEAGAQIATPPERFVRSFEEGLEQVEVELWRRREELAELTRAFEASRPERRAALSAWRARLRIHALLNDAMARLGSDGTLTLISGFVPASRRTALVRRLEREAAGRYFARFEPADGDDTPTRLRNVRIFRPFELFVKTYGLPGYNDVDPTPFVALSFLVMFGMMFGDVGHGLVLAAIGAGMAFLPYRIFAAVRDLGRILMMAGLSGTVFGFLFGSVFGIEEDAVLPALWMRPNHPENLTVFLGVALGLGLGILSLGMLISIVQSLRKRQVLKALLGQWSAASLGFFWALLVLVGLSLAGKPVPAPPGVLAALLAAPLCLIAGGQMTALVLKRRRAAAAGAPAGEPGVREAEAEDPATILFEPVEILMNLFTNSVSFLRVAAFGLAHAALTMAVFTVNDMVRLPGAAFVSLPFEHLFIIVLEGMIVTIQCLRLEYYEFFSKFFSGGGTAYAPLSLGGGDGELGSV